MSSAETPINWKRNLTVTWLGCFLTGVIPLAFFPDAVRGVVQWLPFAAMRDIPLRIYCGTLSGAALWAGLLAQAGRVDEHAARSQQRRRVFEMLPSTIS